MACSIMVMHRTVNAENKGSSPFGPGIGIGRIEFGRLRPYDALWRNWQRSGF